MNHFRLGVAEEFDAWMKAKGIHVATGRQTPAGAGAESAPAESQ